MLKIRFLKSKVLILVLLLVLLPYQNVFAAATSVYVVGVKQINPHWCWAACCEAIFKGPLSTNIDQTQVVRDIMGPYLPDAGASDAQIVRVFDDFGFSSKASSSFLNFATVKEEITAGRPIIAHLSFKDNMLAHAVVITAFDTRNGTNYIWYMDPATGSEYQQPFYNFINGFTWNGKTVVWNTTVYGFKKK